MSIPTSPFKFLDSYGQGDSGIFFGRKNETEGLYQALSGVKHLLVYGPSGAGKTSLVECGLRNQFSDADWFALTIRRGANMISSVFSAINGALSDKLPLDPATKRPLEKSIDFGQAIENLFGERYQPVYLLFDQFEELLISGSEEEKKEFFTRLNQLIRYKVPCRVMLIMREEFIGHLSEYEPLCPSIFQHRFRVEKMRQENVKEVIRNTLDAPYFSAFFQVETSWQLAESILARLPDKSREIELSHVQVFLSELWERAATAATAKKLPRLHKGLVRENDNLSGVLDSFLKKQLSELDTTYGENVALETLAAMISERHTKLQAGPDDLHQELANKGIDLQAPLPNLLRDLEKRRILRTLHSGDQTQYEISHDVLASVVGKNLTEEMQLREKARDVYRVYEAREGLLSREDLDYLRPFEAYLALPASLAQRMLESEAEIERRQREELEKAKKQAQNERRLREEAEQAKREAESQKNMAIKNEKRAIANDLAYKSQVALLYGDRTTAYRLAEFAHCYVDDDNLQVARALMNALESNVTPWASNLEGHLSIVTSVAFSPDGKRLATGAEDKTAKIWDLQTGKAMMTLQGHSSDVTSIAFSPDGKRLATGAEDMTTKIWDLQTGKAIMTLRGHSSIITSVAFSPDGKRLATGAKDMTAKIWDLQTEKAMMTLRGHSSDVTSVAFSPNGKRLATGAEDWTAKIWDLQTGKATLTLQGHSSGVTSVAFSPNGQRLATGAIEMTAKIWDLQTGKVTITLKGHLSSVTSVAFSPDGKRLATGAKDMTAKIWDLQTEKAMMTLRGHSSDVTSVAFSPDGKRLATGAKDMTAKIWDLQTEKAMMTLRGHSSDVTSVAFSPDGQRLATGAKDWTAEIWDLQTEKAMMTLRGHSSDVTSVAFSPDGQRLATGAKDMTAKIWDLQTEKAMMTLRGHSSDVTSVAFSPDGKRLATGAKDMTAKIWDLQTEKAMMTLRGHSSDVTSVAFSPDGQRLATGAKDWTAKIWDLQTEKAMMTLRGHSSDVTSVAFSPDGKRLATGAKDWTTKIWDLQTGKAMMTLRGHSSDVTSVAFSPDGQRLATGARDWTAKIWDLQTGKAIMTLRGHSSDVTSVAFSPDGQRLAGAQNKMAKIWEITAQGCIEIGSQKNLSGLILPQLIEYSLEELLNQQRRNVERLIASGNVWQIKAFADLQANEAAGSNFLAKVNSQYARANRLYTAALALQDEPLIRRDYAAMLRRWAGVYRSDGQEEKAKELEGKADELWPKGK
jgi:WD40 repeat protein